MSETDNVRDAWDAMSAALPNEKKDHWVDGNGNALDARLFTEIADYIRENINKNVSSASILEVGCGTGRICNSLAIFDDLNIVGIDFSKEQISVANSHRKNENVNFFTAELELYASGREYENKSFDVIFCHGVTQYFPSDEYFYSFVDRCLNLLNEGGCVLMIDSPITWYEEFMRGYGTKKTLAKKLKLFVRSTIISIIGESNWTNFRRRSSSNTMVEKLGDTEIEMPRFSGYWIDIEALHKKMTQTQVNLELHYQPFEYKPSDYKKFRPIIRLTRI